VDLEKIREIAERVAAANGLEVTEIDFRGGGGKAGRMLRVFIERNAAGRQALQQSSGDTSLSRLNADLLAGVTHDDCANFSREFSTILDVEDVVPGGAYTLEISSPGLDRKLVKPADYQRFAGSRIKLMTHEPVNGNRHFEGRLESFDGHRLVLDTGAYKKKSKQQEVKRVDIEFANVEKANLVPEI
jgi:ribosome maturation factor RimP